ncbi:glycosyltransferase [Cucumibacter marinus]|uniref:glycosyltransferase n=1 Tax=Cucumibacter marinus TaxID=1121252 RepID=UPI00042383A3|nr:glycosyltransferase family 2 protein [Cucumibacter marinus]
MDHPANTVQDAPQKQAASAGPILSIVIPTLDEAGNILGLIDKLDAALVGIPFEIIVVDDDSRDGTAELVKQAALARADLRCIHRFGRRGLSSACIEGMAASAAPYVAVIDADHQHDETVLPRMLEKARSEGLDIVVASRFAEAGSAEGGLSSIRQKGSKLANAIAGLVAGTRLSDPMSGFFVVRRALFDKVARELSPDGFKILLDIVVSANSAAERIGGKPRIGEVGFEFRERNAGESKMSLTVAVHFLGLVLSKLTGGLLPSSFLMFAMIGFTGVFVHLIALGLIHALPDFNFTNSQLLATIVAMTWNFVLNNRLTYAAQRLKGLSFWLGLFTFYVVCSFGTLANISVASWIYDWQPQLYLAGFAGALMSVVFNYAVTRVVTWRKR